MPRLKMEYFPIEERKVELICLKSIDDNKVRAMIDLKQAKVKKSTRSPTETNYIQISLGKDVILIAFEVLMDFDKWTAVIENSQNP